MPLPRANGIRTPPTIATRRAVVPTNMRFPSSSCELCTYPGAYNRNMLRFSNRTLLGLTATALVACGAKSPPAQPPRPAVPAPPPAQLGLLVERYWAEAAALAPWYAWGGANMPFGETPAENIAPQSLADSLAIERGYLASVSAVPRPSLDPQSKLTYDIFTRGRTLAVEGFTYPLELMPINPFEGMPQAFALSASGAE